MKAEKMPIRIRGTTKAVGGTYDYVKSEKVPSGQLWCIQGIGYENETGARGTFRRGVGRSGGFDWYGEHTEPAADELVFTDKIMYLSPGEALVIRQASCTANDVLKLYAHGYAIIGKFIPGGD